MKRAKTVARRTLADGKVVVHVVCPVCDRRHWLPLTSIGHCPRRCGRFSIGGDR